MASSTVQLIQLLRRIVMFGIDAADDTICDATIGRHPAAKTVAKWVTDPLATTTYRVTVDPSLDCPMMVMSFRAAASAAVTANGSNYALIQLVSNDGAGGADTVIAALDTTVTGFTAGVSRAATVTAANSYVAAGRQVDIVITKPGSGVILPAVSFVLKARMS